MQDSKSIAPLAIIDKEGARFSTACLRELAPLPDTVRSLWAHLCIAGAERDFPLRVPYGSIVRGCWRPEVVDALVAAGLAAREGRDLLLLRVGVE
jgi:hypothetical protein